MKKIVLDKKQKLIALITTGGILTLIVSMLLLLFFYILPENRQNSIKSLISNKQYADATSLISENGDYGETSKLNSLNETGFSFMSGKINEGLEYALGIEATVYVTYDPDGGKTPIESETLSNAVITNEATKDGFTFSTWIIKNFEIDPYEYKVNLDLKATYLANTYKITYNTNGGSLSGEKIYYTPLESFTVPNPTKDGYTFLGWTGSNGEIPDKNLVISTGSFGDKTFSANYEATTYSITYEISGGTLVSPTTYTIEEEVTLGKPERNGYTFTGWTGSNGDTPEQEITLEVGNFGDKHYVANYVAIPYNITLTLNGGEIPSNLDSYTADNEDFTLPTPTKKGYTFTGWTGDNGENPEVEVVVPHGSYGNKTYVANFEANIYTVTIDAGDATLFTDSSCKTEFTARSIQIAYDDTLVMPYYDDYYSKTGYKLKNWYVSTDPSFIYYQTGGRRYTFDHDITVVAQIVCRTYFVSTNLNGGTLPKEYQSISFTIETEGLTVPSPTKDGYTFVGWTGDNGDVPEINPVVPSGRTSYFVVYANWSPTEYTVSYDLDGGTASETLVESYTIESEGFTLPSVTKEGYTFLGWTGSNGDTPQLNVSVKKGTFGSLNYKANFEIINYTITYDLGGGYFVSSDPKTSYNVETGEFKIPADVSKKGYFFLGWTGSNGTEAEYNPVVKSGNQGNLTFKANYSVQSYLVSFEFNGGVYINGGETYYGASYGKYYTIDTILELPTLTKEGYAFVGWYRDKALTTPVASDFPKGETSNMTIYAKYTTAKNNLNITSDSTTQGTVSIVSGSGYSEESITVKATPKTGYIFAGWYSDNYTIASNEPTYTFTMPASAVSLKAKFMSVARAKELCMIPVVDSTSKTVKYGLYPKTAVTNNDTMSVSSTLSNGYGMYNNNYYVKLSPTPYDNSIEFDDGTNIYLGNSSYYFKCEPIVWNILEENNGTYTLVSKQVLDAKVYDDSSNNYGASTIRTWLNSTFYQTAFAFNGSYIQSTEVDNSASTTDSLKNSSTCLNTTDKVYLLSYADYNNSDYGFTSNASRLAYPTDYAKAMGVYRTTGLEEFKNFSTRYWTRSPYSKYGYVSAVYPNGALNTYGYGYKNFGVRPAITIKI